MAKGRAEAYVARMTVPVSRSAASALRCTGLALGLAGGLSTPHGATAEPSAWSTSRFASVRLVDGGPAPADAAVPPGTLLAGVEIRLAPKFITYWRNPGDAGAPPVFDFSGSDNLRDARVLYPAPEKLEEAGSEAFGYRDEVTFPVEVTPKEAGRPVALALKLDYAVCSEICVPVRAETRLELGAATAAETDAVRGALRTVPVPRRLGESGPLGIDAVTPGPGGTAHVDATAPAGAVLFAEAPEPWYVTASAGREEPGGHLGFTLSAPDPRPAGKVPSEPLRLTLTSASGAIDVSVPLDAVIRKP
ncbi:MAG TPA: protein-disulfide reductase DsbD domain-containing protein [Lichenihabitans sp.]|jgi:DsbC/DsbD-like thiol-disulfide interchange protein|nr:protein-disulfide reductase DsbD domain-containing protein [Lichenihabitans sp.]